MQFMKTHRANGVQLRFPRLADKSHTHNVQAKQTRHHTSVLVLCGKMKANTIHAVVATWHFGMISTIACSVKLGVFACGERDEGIGSAGRIGLCAASVLM